MDINVTGTITVMSTSCACGKEDKLGTVCKNCRTKVESIIYITDVKQAAKKDVNNDSSKWEVII